MAAAAQAWLKEKLSTLNGPKATQEMFFAEFPDQFTRDLAVTLLKTAALKRDGKDIWVAQGGGARSQPSGTRSSELLFWIETPFQK